MRGARSCEVIQERSGVRSPIGVRGSHRRRSAVRVARVLAPACAVIWLAGCTAAPSTIRSGAAPSVTASPQASATVPNDPPSSSTSAGHAASARPENPKTAALPSSKAAPPTAVHVTLAPARLPGYAVESWTAQTAGPLQNISGHDIELNECASVHGASTWQQQPYSSSGGNSAILETYTFADAAGAEAAYAGVMSGMHACQATSRALQTANHITADALARQTASAGDAAAFVRTWTAVEGISAPGLQTNHLYLAASGSVVLVLHFDELATGSTAGPYDVRNDPSVLTMLAGLVSRAGNE